MGSLSSNISSAPSFFGPIAIGRYGEEFVDGATGANDPVRELWNQAQDMWGPEPLEKNIKCLVSVGAGVPRDDVFDTGWTPVAIATETEQTAKTFREDKSYLAENGRYYRFNVLSGLEDVGSEEPKERKVIAAATSRYVTSPDVVGQMQACGKYLT
ncbi:hypothetical protein H2201_009005 [Coniosporium apollinis]|uniref:PNPLA domain-containing protein n=1 Tax=Coniosporium apollinis TaxID=61459 RepID=A0ABQ9NHZ1_9PEZI|nr:hypothetical protein H2201_009005 [Coniosporium apollinis]